MGAAVKHFKLGNDGVPLRGYSRVLGSVEP